MGGTSAFAFSLLMLGGMVALMVAVAGWFWLCMGSVREGRRQAFGSLALLVSALAFVFGCLRGGLSVGLMMAAFPPLLMLEMPKVNQFWGFVAQPLLMGALVAGGTLVFCLAMRPLRTWALVIALLAGLGAAAFVGERVSKAAMCQQAAALGITEFRRNTLLWSLANTPREFQFEIHALATTGKGRLGWSYREMAWYAVPVDAAVDVVAPLFDCADR